MNKYELFLDNAEILNNKFRIIPLLYGSLGLEILTDEKLNSDDIDILIPEIFLSDRWEEFRSYLESINYELIDLHEHTFLINNEKISYASVENLEPFAGIKIENLNTYRGNDSLYKLLTLRQYLMVYQKSSLDGYRMNKKEKQDNKKIELIKRKLITY